MTMRELQRVGRHAEQNIRSEGDGEMVRRRYGEEDQHRQDDEILQTETEAERQRGGRKGEDHTNRLTRGYDHALQPT